MTQYGALASAETVEAKSSSKFVIALAAVALVVVGVVAMSSSTGASSPYSAVNSNRYRKQLAPVDPEVREVAMKVLNMTVFGLRWAIFGFNVDKSLMIPLTAGPATNDWDKDFKMFVNALPEMDAAVAVYNFEYWISDEATAKEPIMITWAPTGMDPAEYARAGYFLGNMILELNTDEGRINTEFNNNGDKIGQQKKGAASAPDRSGFSGPYRLDAISDTYTDFCKNEMGLAEEECNMEGEFHNCPFQSEDQEEWTESNPCLKLECDGASFQNPEGAGADAGTIPQSCCDYISNTFCKDPDNVNGGTMGCHAVTLLAISKLCEIPPPAQPVTMFTTVAESTFCDEACVQPCPLMAADDINDTWRKCEGCQTNLQPDENGQISQCFPEALGYEMETCCGIAVDADGVNVCGQDEYLTANACNMMEYYDCKWIPATECPAEQAKQTRAAAPRGCCVAPTSPDFTGDFVAPQFGLDAASFEDDIPSVDCGGGLFAAADDNSKFYAPLEDADTDDMVVQTCAAVQAGMQSQVDAYNAELAAAAAAAGTTAAPARV